jgi:hypothetical protein
VNNKQPSKQAVIKPFFSMGTRNVIRRREKKSMEFGLAQWREQIDLRGFAPGFCTFHCALV